MQMFGKIMKVSDDFKVCSKWFYNKLLNWNSLNSG